MDFSALLTFDTLAAFLTLTVLEVVLGIDNLVFIAISSGRLPAEQQKGARRLGLVGAMVMRLGLLLALSWLAGLTEPFFTAQVMERDIAVSWRDVVLVVGGLVLLWKSTMEIGHVMGDDGHRAQSATKRATMTVVIAQIMLMDMVFSIDSVVTAVGMVDPDKVIIMVAAIVTSMVVMLVFAEPVSNFVLTYPSVKMLALSFLLLIGMMLVADGFGFHVPKGYLYFAMAFSGLVEGLNLRAAAKRRAADAALAAQEKGAPAVPSERP
ncbi:MAG: TerC family protein [Planctomycetota bacterium]|nr:TerC family protein [Planctomycetota bacterium]MDA1106281.1 TerC family protein [Planctomycetota bacterium]